MKTALLIPSTERLWFVPTDIRLTMRKISVTWAIAFGYKKPDHLVAPSAGS